ncbi:MAG: hypothetical protein IJR47_02525 [Clostridia bacterium]|nr:hypothetical protein [Clostridia bacterium]
MPDKQLTTVTNPQRNTLTTAKMPSEAGFLLKRKSSETKRTITCLGK